MANTIVGTPTSTPPEHLTGGVQSQIYETLRRLGIEFLRVDCSPAITMDDCEAIGQALDCHIVKTILLTNRQQNKFWLFVSRGDKPFDTRTFCGALGIPRVSFASKELLMELLGTEVGATTILSAVRDSAANVEIVIDNEAIADQWYGCSDSTTTSYIKLRSRDLVDKYLSSANHTPIFIHYPKIAVK